MAKIKIGIIVYSFSYRGEDREPNPCNVRLAKAVQRIKEKLEKEDREVVVAAEWEVAEALKSFDIELSYPNHEHLGSLGIWQMAKTEFRERGVRDIIVVAHPFLHLSKVKSYVTKDSEFELVSGYDKMIGKIGYDNESLQWWTRGPVRLILYAFKQLF